MMRSKVVSFTALLGATALTLAACSSGAAPGGSKSGGSTGEAVSTTTFKVAFNQQPTHPQYVAIDAMGDRIKERTNGAYDLEVFPNETLGAQKETIELVQSGTIEFAMVAAPLLENYNPDFVVFNLPFTFDSQDHQRETTNDPEIVSELYASLDDQNLRVLGSFHGGIRSMYNSIKPDRHARGHGGHEDPRHRVRDQHRDDEAHGGDGHPDGHGRRLHRHPVRRIDGAENNELTYSGVKHSEVAPYYSYTKHLMLPDYLITNPAVMDGLPEDVQEIFAEEIATAIEEEGDLWKSQIDVAKQDAIDAGAKFNEVDEEAFAEAIAPLTKSKLTNDFIKDIHAKVRAAAE